MKFLLLGSTGMLGQTLLKTLRDKGFSVITSSRNNSDYNIDFLSESNKINKIIMKEKPSIVINSAAIVNLKYCESNPGDAYIINSRLPGLIAQSCAKNNSYFVHISTDHYYKNDKFKVHNEDDEIELVNEYARTKFAGESFVLTIKNSLVIRTNIVGFRNKTGSPTFVEWIIKSLESNEEIIGFDDFFTSSIDVQTFSNILIELMEKRITGLINVASTDTISKYEFISYLAELLGKEQYVKRGYLNSMPGIERANSLGLDVTKLRGILKQSTLPSSKKVIQNIFNQYKGGSYHELQK